MKDQTINNACSLMLEYAHKHPDQPAIIQSSYSKFKNILRHKSISYRELDQKSSSLACGLNGIGIEKNDNVLILMPMSIELYTVILSLFKTGTSIVLIDPSIGPDQINAACALVKPKAMISISRAFILGLKLNEIGKIKIKINSSPVNFLTKYSLKNLYDKKRLVYDITPVRSDDTALITFTTGSTGIPKGADRSHDFLKKQNKILSLVLQAEKGSAELVGLPVFVLNNLANGIISVIPCIKKTGIKKFDPVPVIRQAEELNVTRSIGSPFFYEKLADHMITNGIKNCFIKDIHTGGGPVTEQLMFKIKSAYPSCRITVVYGSTEAEPVAMIGYDELISQKAFNNPLKGFCVGKSVKGLETAIIGITDENIDFSKNDKNDYLLDKNIIGEIIVRGDHVNKNYYKNNEAFLKNKIPDKNNEIWHRTGDTGYIDDKDNIWLCGRKNRCIFKNEKIFHPLLIEPAVNALDFTEKSAVMQLNDGSVAVFAELKKGIKQKKIFKDIISDVFAKTALRPDIIKFIKKMPLDPRHNTKINYEKLKKFI